MNELKCKYQYIPTVTLHIVEEIATTRLGISANEGFEAQIANLVEVFLVEMYRCKICQFTTSIKNKIKIHVSSDHQLDRIHLISESPGIGHDQEENDNYSLVDEMGQENKENEVNLEKMPFLLPMYRILNTMSPDSCDISLGDHIDSAQVAHTCEVNTLFEEESSNFQLDESGSVVSNTIPGAADASESKKSKDDEEAQSEHLMSLGLCRTSSIRSQALVAEVKAPMPEAKWASNISRQKDNIQHGCSEKNNFHLRLREDRRKHFCDICEIQLQSKELYKIHMTCHNDDQGFKCLHCSCYMPDWNLMEQHIETHMQLKDTYKCLVCDKEFVMRSAWKLHRKTHHKKLSVFQCTKCPSFYTSEQVRNLHVACHYEDQFKCLHCDLKDKEWKKVYKHVCTHDYSLNPHPCPQCEQRFFSVAELKEHIAKHKVSSSSVCSLCGQAFKCRRQLNKHHRRVHQKQNAYQRKRRRKEQASTLGHPDTEETTKTRKRSSKEYSCNACSRKCSSKLALQRHMGVHAGVTPFHCQHCEYKTRLKASLIQHMRIHTGEKPFRCETCSYASIDASSLRRHCRTHTSERPYTCHLCSYSCIQKKSLDLHVRRHHTGEAFSCGYCPYSSPDKQLLQKHIRKYHLAMESSLADEQPISDNKTFAASD